MKIKINRGNVTLLKQYKPIISILVFKLRLREFSTEHLMNHPLLLPLSSLD